MEAKFVKSCRAIMLVLLSICFTGVSAQAFTSWIVGDTADVVVPVQPGMVLAGGAGDNDDAMRWMLSRAQGGDVLVLRATGEDGYNAYFYEDLGVVVNSVETIRLDSEASSTDPYVSRRIGEAEVIFWAGGDQLDYYWLFYDTPFGEAVRKAWNGGPLVVGGTSAGMAILGSASYIAREGSLTSEQALNDPFHPNTDLIEAGGFFDFAYLDQVITDTHFEERDRQGRMMVFLARLYEQEQARYFGIACDDYTAVAIDADGMARVFGEYPEFEDYAYFFTTNCQVDGGPQFMEPGAPLGWDHPDGAVQVYKVPGTQSGENYVLLEDEGNEPRQNLGKMWKGGQWEAWSVVEGQWTVDSLYGVPCDLILTNAESVIHQPMIQVYPNPGRDVIYVISRSLVQSLKVFDPVGRQVYSSVGALHSDMLHVSSWSPGLYVLQVQTARGTLQYKVLVSPW